MTMKGIKVARQKVPYAVLLPCLIAALLAGFTGLENALWRLGKSYPAALAQTRYVDDIHLLTPQAVRDICSMPLAQPELVKKSNGLYLRCGTPLLEGVYRIAR
ncbi:hypothetical protein [Enterobacter cancerogenus]|uniref:hypothetical protein n=1 Tax=Enterobacter cancerogenus TaxID=69218 RepID=UPI001D0E4BC9|nr:hypothetical protein [Enterobacter cancerogenus]